MTDDNARGLGATIGIAVTVGVFLAYLRMWDALAVYSIVTGGLALTAALSVLCGRIAKGRKDS